MAKFILYLITITTFLPLFAMAPDSMPVILNAPEYWIEKNGNYEQCDLDEAGQPCELGPREGSLESEYVSSFPKLQHYLAENDNRFKGFDPKKFNLLKDCLQLSYIYKNTQESNEKKRIKNQIKVLFDNPEHSPRKLIDAVYVSRLAGLSVIEKLAAKAFKKRTITRMVKEGEDEVERSRPIAIDEIYDSLDDSYWKDTYGVSLESDSDNSEDGTVDASFGQKVKVGLGSWMAWIKNLLPKKQTVITPLSKELVRFKASPFSHLKLKKVESNSWFQKIKIGQRLFFVNKNWLFNCGEFL